MGIAYLGGAAYGVAVLSLGVIGIYEWVRMVEPGATPQTRGSLCFLFLLLFVLPCLVWLSYLFYTLPTPPQVFGWFFQGPEAMSLSTIIAGGILVVIVGLAGFSVKRMVEALASFAALFWRLGQEGLRKDFAHPAWVLGGFTYMGSAALALLYIRTLPSLVHKAGMFSLLPKYQLGREMILYLLAVVWATDSFAFIVGRLVGGPKLAPKISPGKTWAGACGGLLGAALATLPVAWLLARPFEELLPLSLALSFAAQLGDLFESYVKRRFGVKDSGTLIPGHGGVLDRIDGLIFAAVPFALFLALWHGCCHLAPSE